MVKKWHLTDYIFMHQHGTHDIKTMRAMRRAECLTNHCLTTAVFDFNIVPIHQI